jgi:hypothetical protein
MLITGGYVGGEADEDDSIKNCELHPIYSLYGCEPFPLSVLVVSRVVF